MNFAQFRRQVGLNIRAARARRGLLQAEIEDKIGLEYKHYQKIEAGKVNVSLETLFRLANLFKVGVEELVRIFK